MRAFIYLFATLVMLTTQVASADPTIEESEIITQRRLDEYSRNQHAIAPKGEDVADRVRAMWGPGPYTARQIAAALHPTTKGEKIYNPKDHVQVGKKLPGALYRSAALQQLDDYERFTPDAPKLLTYKAPPTPEHPKKVTIKIARLEDALKEKYGLQDWYTPAQLADVESNGIAPAKVPREWPEGNPIRAEVDVASVRTKTWSEDFKKPLIRQSWRDVLYEEDPSQDSNAVKPLKDLVGATFSYAYNGKTDSDTWTAIGALIFPWEHDFKLDPGLTPARIALAPSVSINRVATNGDSKTETDSVLYRLGAYAEWYLAASPPVKLQVRAAGVYASDTGGDAALPGYEVDAEPRWQSDYFPLGYKKVLIPKATEKEDRSDWWALAYQLRAWLHIEGGDVQDNGKSWDAVKGYFFRLGPTVQFQLDAPRVFLGRDASLTALYSWLPALSGTREHESYFKLSAVYDLFKNDVHNQKVSLTVQYENGGLNFTKEDVDTVTVGLGVLY